MLKRIYVNNFRCLVNFELSVDSINLFLGPNGTGKSAVFDVLYKIQAFLRGSHRTGAVFEKTDLTRWQNSPIQNFELEVEASDGIYKYELAVESVEKHMFPLVYYERLWFNRQLLLRFDPSSDVEFYPDDSSECLRFPFDRSRSAVSSVAPGPGSKKLSWFRNQMERFIIVRVIPPMMAEDSGQEETQLSFHMENFVSWYRHIYQDQGKAFEITEALREVLDGFDYFRLKEAGEKNRVLWLAFSDKERGNSVEYRFDELSDGQRTLIVLYTLVHYARSRDYTLCIDEPENFVALPEIQPWLTTLYDFCCAGEVQAVLISHHPELIDYLASSAGYWFDRQSNSPVRVRRIADKGDGGLAISELVARGWLYD